MATDRQIAANRANSLKSTGPSTPDGRKISSRNSTRHGLFAANVTLEGESLERFEFLMAGLREMFQPTDVIEECLIENMAISRWRQMRVWAVERAGLNRNMKSVPDDADPGDPDLPARAAFAFESQTQLLDSIARHETRFDRQFNRALDRLMKLRREKI